MTRSWMLLLGVTGLALAACTQDEAGSNAAASEAAKQETGKQSEGTLDAALADSADQSRFVEALRGAGLIETLGGAGPYTVFAPANAAFDALPQGERAILTAPEQRDGLIALLSGHIVSGTVTAADLRRAVDRGTGNRAELATVGGGTLSVTRDGDTLVLTDGAGGQARIAGTERIQANGVIHGIDAVLRPAAAE